MQKKLGRRCILSSGSVRAPSFKFSFSPGVCCYQQRQLFINNPSSAINGNELVHLIPSHNGSIEGKNLGMALIGGKNKETKQTNIPNIILCLWYQRKNPTHQPLDSRVGSTECHTPTPQMVR